MDDQIGLNHWCRYGKRSIGLVVVLIALISRTIHIQDHPDVTRPSASAARYGHAPVDRIRGASCDARRANAR